MSLRAAGLDARLDARLDSSLAARLAAIALGHVRQVYPNHVSLRLDGAGDAVLPDVGTPIFRGSFDWHSCVHGYWTLTRIRRLFPEIREAVAIDALFAEEITEANAAAERDWLAAPRNKAWERPYGWAWLLMLVAELRLLDTGTPYADRLQPAADIVSARLRDYLPRLTYPVRSGVHSNTAFALILALRYARVSADAGLADAIVDAAQRWFVPDMKCRAWGEPSGEDFLSPSLSEAALMRRLLDAPSFEAWFRRFMPSVPRHLLTPATVSDRSDGRIAHLDGLNLSRAWCWRMIGTQPRAVDAHLKASLKHVAGDYMGEHWLASFALLALSEV